MGWLYSEFYVKKYRKPGTNNSGSIFLCFPPKIRFCRLENETLLDKLETGSSPSVMETWS